MIGRLEFGTDKPGKDTNFRGITIFNNTLYVAKGSGGNGVNTVYQVGTAGTLPTGTAADSRPCRSPSCRDSPTRPPAQQPRFPSASGSPTRTRSMFAMRATDAGDPAGQRKRGRRPNPGHRRPAEMEPDERQLGHALRPAGRPEYRRALQRPNYPSSLNPATGGCRNITGRHNHDGTVTIYAITSTISANGDRRRPEQTGEGHRSFERHHAAAGDGATIGDASSAIS